MKQKRAFKIAIVYTRPDFGESVECLKCYHATKPEDEKELEYIFTEAFKKAHPSWSLKRISVTQAR